MSHTHKIQRAHEAYKNSPYPFSVMTPEIAKACDEISKVGRRYGNQRRMRANLKWKARKVRRHALKQEVFDAA